MLRSTIIPSALILLACGLAPFATAEDVPRNTRYLALGDSIAFGYNPLVIPVNLDKYVGYPEIVSDAIHRKVANASCFGESSGSFLVLGAPDTGCAQWRASLPLYVSYSGTQMQYALDYLQRQPQEDRPDHHRHRRQRPRRPARILQLRCDVR